MTGLTEAGRVKRANKRRAKEERKRKKIQKEIALHLARTILPIREEKK